MHHQQLDRKIEFHYGKCDRHEMGNHTYSSRQCSQRYNKIAASQALYQSVSNDNTTTPWLQTGWMLAIETMKWTQMHDFHSTTEDWPSILNLQPQFPLTGTSLLEWMMLQPYSNESWRSRYTWTKELDCPNCPFTAPQ